MIRSVTGVIEKKSLGITMCHEHLALNLSGVRKEQDSNFDDIEQVKHEVLKAKKYGVKSFIEVTCNDMGRDVLALEHISKVCDVNIIAATGCYLDEYHSETIKKSSIDDIAKVFVNDIQVGMDGTNIKAGIIAEVASGLEMSESEQKVLRAAARASNITNCPISTHCQMGELAFEQIAIFKSEGVDLTSVLLGHLDLKDDVEYHKSILDTKVNIAFDTIGKTDYLSDERRADNLVELIRSGYVSQLFLSQDISRKSYFSINENKHGYTTVMKTFIPLLQQRGITDEQLRIMLVDNPARLLDF